MERTYHQGPEPSGKMMEHSGVRQALGLDTDWGGNQSGAWLWIPQQLGKGHETEEQQRPFLWGSQDCNSGGTDSGRHPNSILPVR